MGKKSSPKPPSAKETAKVAEQTAASNWAATNEQTMANRPNQTDIYGNTSTWKKGKNGQWTQTQALSGQNQAMLDQQNAMKSGLMNQAQNSLGKPLDLSGLPDWQQYDPSKLQGVDANIGANTGEMGQLSGQYGQMGQLQDSYGPTGKLQENYGNVGQLQENYGPMGNLQGAGQFTMDPSGNAKAIQDATYGLLAPQRQMAMNSEIQRLKNQGLTEDSPAFQRAMMRQNQADTDAQLRSLLAGQQEYGNQFQRGLSQNQSNFGQNLSAAQLANQQQNQLFGQDLSRAGLASSNQNQLFGQDVTRAGLANQLQNQLFGQGMSRAQLADAQNQQRYQQDLGQANFANQSQNQRFGQNEAQQRLAMALRGQQFGEQGDMAQQAMAQRGMMLGEREALRQSPLNDLQQLMQMQQYNNPAFGQFTAAGNAGGTDYTGAFNQAQAAAQAAANAKNQSASNTTSGLMGLAGTAMMVF